MIMLIMYIEYNVNGMRYDIYELLNFEKQKVKEREFMQRYWHVLNIYKNFIIPIFEFYIIIYDYKK